MSHFTLKTADGKSITFRLYEEEALTTCRAFVNTLPFEAQAVQARTAGLEIWIPEGPELKIPPENATVHLDLGEIGIAPVYPRNKVARSIAIIYGKATLYDCVNVFAKVLDRDLGLLQELGEKTWLSGRQILRFEAA